MSTKAKKPRVSDQVFEQMKDMIIGQKWLPGDKLPSEQALCELFGISRVTVRSALFKLNTLRLIDTFLGDGSYVRKLDMEVVLNNLVPIACLDGDFESILEFRMEVESGTCAIAARKATKSDIAELRELLEKMLAAQDDWNALSVLDLEFHYAIARISQNNLLIKTYEMVLNIYMPHMKQIVNTMGGDWGVYYHGKIVDALEAHDTPGARQIMYEHILKNLEFVRESGGSSVTQTMGCAPITGGKHGVRQRACRVAGKQGKGPAEKCGNERRRE